MAKKIFAKMAQYLPNLWKLLLLCVIIIACSIIALCIYNGVVSDNTMCNCNNCIGGSNTSNPIVPTVESTPVYTVLPTPTVESTPTVVSTPANSGLFEPTGKSNVIPEGVTCTTNTQPGFNSGYVEGAGSQTSTTGFNSGFENGQNVPSMENMTIQDFTS